MKKNDNKTLLTAVVIIAIVALIAVNLDTTGQVTKNPRTTVSVSPSRILAGQYITITINPGVAGTNEKVKIIDSNGVTMAKNIKPRGVTRIYYDKKTIYYKTGADWDPGVYRVVATDEATGTNSYGYFTIE